MITQQIRKVGNSHVVTIPKEDMERLNLQEGDIISFDPNKMELRPVLNPAVASLLDEDIEILKPMLDYLKDH